MYIEGGAQENRQRQTISKQTEAEKSSGGAAGDGIPVDISGRGGGIDTSPGSRHDGSPTSLEGVDDGTRLSIKGDGEMVHTNSGGRQGCCGIAADLHSDGGWRLDDYIKADRIERHLGWWICCLAIRWVVTGGTIRGS